MSEKVYITPCEDYSMQKVHQALLDNLVRTGLLNFVKPGMTIAVKVNLVTMAVPEKAVTTHPALVTELCRLLVQMGAKVIVGDSPGGLWTPAYVNSIYKNSGFKSIEETGAVLNDDFSVKEASFPEAASLKTFKYTAWLDKADAIIDFCKLKTHGMLAMTCAVKNMFGTIPGAMKPECHMRFPDIRDFANVMIDLNEFFKPALYICDAVDAMEGNGPSSGTPRHIGAVISGSSPYELDMVCAQLIGLDRSDVQTLEEAFARGLGPESAASVEIEGNADLFVKSDFKRATGVKSIQFGGSGIIDGLKSFFMKKVFETRPEANTGKCTACGKCAQICPAHAIRMDARPVIDRSKCIHCFCCQEFCPVGAMHVHRTLIAKILEK